MIGLVMRSTMGSPGGIFACCLAVLGLCAVWKLCCNCQLRDCGCIKWFFRKCGVDPFDDFEVQFLIHHVKFTASSAMTTKVKVSAGRYVAETDPSDNKNFQQSISMFIAQGTSVVDFDLVDHRDRLVAQYRMDIMKDLLIDKDGDGAPDTVREKPFTMKQKQKGILTPTICLTWSAAEIGDEEKALLSNIDASAETQAALARHLQDRKTEPGSSVATMSSPTSETQLLAETCAGPVEKFKRMGGRSNVYIVIVGPPTMKKWKLLVYDTQEDFAAGRPPQDEITMLLVTAVSPDPKRPDVFKVDYMDDQKKRNSITFGRVDRSREVWVEMLQLALKKIHRDYADRKKGTSGKKGKK